MGSFAVIPVSKRLQRRHPQKACAGQSVYLLRDLANVCKKRSVVLLLERKINMVRNPSGALVKRQGKANSNVIIPSSNYGQNATKYHLVRHDGIQMCWGETCCEWLRNLQMAGFSRASLLLASHQSYHQAGPQGGKWHLSK